MLTKKALGLMIGALLSGALIGGEAAAGQTLSRPRRFMKTARSMPGISSCASAFVNM